VPPAFGYEVDFDHVGEQILYIYLNTQIILLK